MLERLVEEGVHAADPGIADQDIQPSIGGERRRNHGFDLVRPRDIRPHRGGAAAGGGDLVAHADHVRLVGIGDHDGAALAGEPDRYGAAQPAPRPGDDRRLVGEAHGIVLSVWSVAVSFDFAQDEVTVLLPSSTSKLPAS